MRFILICLLFFQSLFSVASNEWTHIFGGTGNDEARKVIVAKGGGWITSGFTTSYSNSGNNAMVVRWNKKGEIIWQKVIGDSLDNFGYSVAQDLNGFIYVAGSTNGTSSHGSLDMYLVKLDSSGNVLWEKTYGGPQSDEANSIVLDSNGDIVLAGTTQSFGSGGADAFVLKVDSAGTSIWSKTFGGAGNENFQAITPIRGGGYVLVGSSSSFGNNHGYAVRINNVGDSLWTKSYYLGNYRIPGIINDVKQKDDSALIYTGFSETSNFGNMFHMKTDLNGSLIYFRTSNNLADGGLSIITTSDSGYAIVGYNTNFETSGFLRKFSSSGNQIWERYFKRYSFYYYLLLCENYSVVQNDNGTFTIAGIAGLNGWDGSVDGLIMSIDSSGCDIPELNTPLSANPSSNFCDSASVNTILNAPSGYVSYQWLDYTNGMVRINGANSNTYHAKLAGIYYCLLTSTDNVYYSVPIQISVTAPISQPLVSPAGIFNGCLASSYADGLLSTTNVIGYNYQWLLNGSPIPSANSDYYNPKTNGLYSVIAYNNCSADTSLATDMRLNEGPRNNTISALQDTIFCGKSQTLTLQSNFNQSYYNYAWMVNNSLMSNSPNKNFLDVYVSGNYSLIVRNQCGSDTSNYISVRVDSNAVPTIGTSGTPDLTVYSASGTDYYCGSHTLIYSGQNISSPCIYKWKLNGTTLLGTSSTYTAYTPGTYTLTIHDTCGNSAESSPFVVNATPGGDSITVTNAGSCSYTTLTVANQSNACSWYVIGQPNSVSTSNVYNTINAGSYYCTFQPTNCPLPIITNTVTIASSTGYASISASPSASVCSGNILLTVSETNASYVWKLDGIVIAGANSQSYIATQTGTYYCVISRAGCRIDSVDALILIGTNKIICNQPILCPHNRVDFRVFISEAGTTYQWRRNGIDLTGATQDYLYMNLAGSYDLRITGICGSYLTNSITINSLPKNLSPSGTIHLCDGDTVNLAAPSGAGYTYRWFKDIFSIPDTTQNLLVSSSRNIFSRDTILIKVQILYPGVCWYDTDQDTIIIHKSLPNNIYSSTAIERCGDDSVQLNARTGTGYNYQWYRNTLPIPASNNDKLMVSDSGDYTVSIDYYAGCISNSNIISVNNNMISGSIAVTGSPILCYGDSVQLQLMPTANFYHWSHNNVILGGATSQNYYANDGGIYSVAFSDNSGCTGNESVTIYSIPFTNDQITMQTTNLCSGDSIDLVSYSRNLNFYSRNANQWYFNGVEIPGETNFYLYASQNGNYKIVSMQSCCVVSNDSVDIQFPSTPYSHISSSQNSLCNSSYVTLIADPGLNQSFQWKKNGLDIPGAIYANYNAVTDATYTCQITTSCGVAISNDITITSSFSASLSSSGSTTFCNPDSIQLNALPVSPIYTYEWRRNNVIISAATSSTLYASITGNYSVMISDTNGCFNTSNLISVTALAHVPAPVITTTSPILCPNSSMNMSVDSSIFISHYWRQNGVNIGGATYASYSTAATGLYDCVVASTCGSGTSLPVYVNNGIAPIVNLGNDTTLCIGAYIYLNAGINYGNFYSWSNNTADYYLFFTSQVEDTNLVYVQVINTYGCSASDSILLTFSVCTYVNPLIEQEQIIFFPNPVNDHLFVYNQFEQAYTINIVDLTGRIVLTKKLQTNTAEIDMSMCSPGAYFVIVKSVKGVYQKKIIKE